MVTVLDTGLKTTQVTREEITAVTSWVKEGRKEVFYLTTHSTLIYGYMASDIW